MLVVKEAVMLTTELLEIYNVVNWSNKIVLEEKSRRQGSTINTNCVTKTKSPFVFCRHLICNSYFQMNDR